MTVPATRAELNRIEERMAAAMRARRVLSDRLRALTDAHMQAVERARAQRQGLECKLGGALSEFALCMGGMDARKLEQALMCPARTAEVAVREAEVAGVSVPGFELNAGRVQGAGLGYSPVCTGAQLDVALAQLDGLLPGIVELAQMEKARDMLRCELERVRRRMAALDAYALELKARGRDVLLRIEREEYGARARMAHAASTDISMRYTAYTAYAAHTAHTALRHT